MAKDYECERRKCYDLTEQITEKTRQVKKLQLVCDKLRKKAVLGQVASQIDLQQQSSNNHQFHQHQHQNQHQQQQRKSTTAPISHTNSTWLDSDETKSSSQQERFGNSSFVLQSPLSMSTPSHGRFKKKTGL